MRIVSEGERGQEEIETYKGSSCCSEVTMSSVSGNISSSSKIGAMVNSSSDSSEFSSPEKDHTMLPLEELDLILGDEITPGERGDLELPYDGTTISDEITPGERGGDLGLSQEDICNLQ